MSAMFYAYDAPTLVRAAEHGCLDEDVETGDPIVCGACPVSRVQAIEAAEDHADQVVFDAWRERGL